MIDKEILRNTIKESDEELNKKLLELFEFDKVDEIILKKEEFEIKMSIVKLIITSNQMEIMTKVKIESIKNILKDE